VIVYSAFTSADPIGSETPINTYVTDSQERPSIAMAADGRSVIVWQSWLQDNDNFGIFGQMLTNTGAFQGSEFKVNTYNATQQYDCDVAMNSSGAFVVTWTSYGADGNNLGVCAQRYDSSGVAQGSEFVVNSHTSGDQFGPCVAMNESGEFIIAWTDGDGQDGDQTGIFAKRYTSAGVGSAEFQVNTYTTGLQYDSSIAICGNGSFMISWGSALGDGNGYGVCARRYYSNGTAWGSEFVVNTYTASNQLFPAVAMNESGVSVVAWVSSGQDGGGYGVYAQKYNADGSAMGGEFRVNNYTSGDQSGCDVGIAPNDHFVITWYSVGQDGGGAGIYAREYTLSGTNSSEFLVNTYTSNDQYLPKVAMDALGDYTIVWYSNLQDGDEYGIYAQRYNNVLLIPEFGEIMLPVIGIVALFLLIGKLGKRRE